MNRVPAAPPHADERRGPYIACLSLFILDAFGDTDLSFLTDDATLRWLLNDYTENLIPLIAVLLLPTVRAAARAAFGPLQWPVEPPRHLTLFVVLSMCVVLDFVIWEFLRPPLSEVLPDIRIDRYPKVENAALAWFDLAFGLALAAISEEIGYRVIMARVLRGFTANAIVIVVVSALVFGAYHWPHGLANVFSASLSGAIYMTLYLKCGSILPSMAVHYATNLIGFHAWYFD